MRISRSFRPTPIGPLEDRAVPSRAPLSVAILVETAVPLPPQIEGLGSVRQAFASFLQQYNQAYNTALSASSPLGTATANQSTFNAEVKSALMALDSALTTAVASQPSSDQLSRQIDAEVLGPGPNSLESVLLGLPSPFTSASILLSPVAAAPTTASSPTHPATTDLRSVTLPQVAQGSSGDAGGTILASGPASSATTPATPQKVRSAFSAFLSSYSSAVQKVLLAPGADGSVNPAANRAAFDAKVSEAVKVLNGTVQSAIGSIPGSAGLASKARSALVAPGGGLQSKLAALPTPASGDPAVVGLFGESSVQAVGGVLSALMGDVSAYLRNISPGL